MSRTWLRGPEFHRGPDGFNIETAGWRKAVREGLERQADGHERPRECHEAHVRQVRQAETVPAELARLQRRYDELEVKIRAAERAAPASAPKREYATRGSRPLSQHTQEFRAWAQGALRAHRDGVVWPDWKDVKSGKAKLPI